tara:strand:+ start:179 stop:523 length:345 start_codon:yes stop_codon:yes gene_type:complete
MFLIHEMGEMSVQQLEAKIDPPATEAGARRLMGILYKKGLIRMHKEGRKKIYSPVESSLDTGLKALRDVLGSFFKGSPSLGISKLLDTDSSKYSEKELDAIEDALTEIRKRNQD